MEGGSTGIVVGQLVAVLQLQEGLLNTSSIKLHMELGSFDGLGFSQSLCHRFYRRSS